MKLLRKILLHYVQKFAYQIRLSRMRYRYSPSYAISWLLSDIFLRIALLALPLILLGWQFIDPRKLPSIPEYPNPLSYNFARQATIIQQTEDPIQITADETIIIAANHYQLKNGVLNIQARQQSIRAEHMLIIDNVFNLKDNVHFNKDKQMDFYTDHMVLDNQRNIAKGKQKITGNFSEYEFFADSFNYDNRTEILALHGNSNFYSKKMSLSGKNGIVLASKQNKLLVKQAEFLNNQGSKASSKQLEGIFTDQNNDKKLKQLHFIDEFLYNWQDNIITGEQAILHLTKDLSDADYMIITGNVIASSEARTITANEAYVDYASEMVEMCGDTEIITKGGKKFTTPCATFSLKENSQLSMRQNKRLLQ